MYRTKHALLYYRHMARMAGDVRFKLTNRDAISINTMFLGDPRSTITILHKNIENPTLTQPPAIARIQMHTCILHTYTVSV